MADYSPEDVSTVCKEILRRIEGGMKDEEFESFRSMIAPPVEGCRMCGNSGVFEVNHALVVCRSCDYHRTRGRALTVTEPESIKKGRK